MIESHPSDVLAAFEILLEAVEVEIDLASKAGAQAFASRDLAHVSTAADRVSQVTGFRVEVIALRKKWQNLSPTSKAGAGKGAPRGEHADRGRAPTGVRTPEDAYFRPILQALVEMGGKGRVNDILERVGRQMQGHLNEVDHQPLQSSPDMPRWRNAAQWARFTMVQSGLLKADSPHGVWEISDKGRQLLK